MGCSEHATGIYYKHVGFEARNKDKLRLRCLETSHKDFSLNFLMTRTIFSLLPRASLKASIVGQTLEFKTQSKISGWDEIMSAKLETEMPSSRK